jgi:hypothetical protein
LSSPRKKIIIDCLGENAKRIVYHKARGSDFRIDTDPVADGNMPEESDKVSLASGKSIFIAYYLIYDFPIDKERFYAILYVDRKGKPGESRRRKAMGLKP